MTAAECEIVAAAGIRVRAIAEVLTIGANETLSDLQPAWLVGRMDECALMLSEVYGALSALPLEAEGEE